MEALNEQELMRIQALLEKTAEKYPNDEQSAERVCMMQDSLGFGEVYTFSRDGVSVVDVSEEDMEKVRKYSKLFTIPAREGFEGVVRRLYQCVFVYKDRVFSCELEEDMSLSEYKTALKKLNGVFIRIKREHRERRESAA